MGDFLWSKFRANPEFSRLTALRNSNGESLKREVEKILNSWSGRTGKQWEVVPEGVVQRLTGEARNYASMQGNRLLIESQILTNPKHFYDEVVHELVAASIGGRGTPLVFITGFESWNSQKLLETWIMNTGSFDWFKRFFAGSPP